MNRIARLFSLAALLLLIFLAAVLASWIMLRRQVSEIQGTAITTRQVQLARTLELTHPPSPPWSESYIKDLNTLLESRIDILTAEEFEKNSSTRPWYFKYRWSDQDSGTVVHLGVSISPSHAAQIGHLVRYTSLVLLVLALGSVCLIGIIILFNLGQRPGGKPGEPAVDSSHGFESLTHLAKISVKQQAELERERIERLRADEDLHFQQILLNRSLEEKIQLGRELHDGIIQSLYATGLTFEAARKNLGTKPADAAQQLEAGLKALNATIRDVRSYINGLSPDNLRQQSFSDAVLALTQSLGSGRETKFDVRIDDAASARLADAVTIQLLQIIRESISNSLRHGAASLITVRLHEGGDELALLIQDNGKGFDMAGTERRGHGLENIKARASAIEAHARISSVPGEGTRIVITLPPSAGKS